MDIINLFIIFFYVITNSSRFVLPNILFVSAICYMCEIILIIKLLNVLLKWKFNVFIKDKYIDKKRVTFIVFISHANEFSVPIRNKIQRENQKTMSVLNVVKLIKYIKKHNNKIVTRK